MSVSRRSLAILGAASLFALSLAVTGVTPAAAATLTYNVNTTSDVAYALPTVACAPDPAPQLVPCSIRAALQQANLAPAGTVTQVRVPAGTYKITIANTCANDGDACGDFNVNSNVVLTGAGQDTTIIDANQLDRGFSVGSAGNLQMSGVTVRNGNANGARACSTDRGVGGGIVVTGLLSLSNSTISGNQAFNIGGGIAEAANAPSATILDHVTVRGNTAQLGGGAAQTAVNNCANPSVVFTGRLEIKNSLVTENTATSYTAGVDEDAGGTVVITDSVISHNAAHNGGNSSDVGGVAEDGGGSVTITGTTIDSNTTDQQAGGVVEDGGGTLTMRHSVVSNNTAHDSAAGIYLDGGGKITLDHLEIFGNTAVGVATSNGAFTGGGGGITEDGGDATTMTDIYIHDNHASHGAGMYLDGGGQFDIANLTVSNNSTTVLKPAASYDGIGAGILVTAGNKVTMINSTISGNTSFSRGGGLLVEPTNLRNGRAQPVSIAFSTIAGNTAATGGQDIQLVTPGEGAAPVVNLRATIVAGTGTSCGDVKPNSQGYNLDSGTSCALSQAGDQSGVDPRLAALTNNGGFEPTRALIAGSPAIDVVASGCPPPSTDQRGVVRPQGTLCDVGAYEYVTPAPVSTPVSGQAPAVTPTLPKAGARVQPGPGGGPGVGLVTALVLVLTALGMARLRGARQGG